MTAQARQLVAAAAGRYGDLDITAVGRPYRQVASTSDETPRWAVVPTPAPAR